MNDLQKKEELIMENRPKNGNNKIVSDEVIIEIVHAFKDIIIEFISRKYAAGA